MVREWVVSRERRCSILASRSVFLCEGLGLEDKDDACSWGPLFLLLSNRVD